MKVSTLMHAQYLFSKEILYQDRYLQVLPGDTIFTKTRLRHQRREIINEINKRTGLNL